MWTLPNQPTPEQIEHLQPYAGKGQLATLATGHLLLANLAPPVHGGADRREYTAIFMQPGRVKKADQTPSKWLIPAETIKASAHLFNSLPVYLDHPERYGFGWHQSPRVANLVGITFDAHWSDEEKALVGSIRLYDQDANSPGRLVGALLDQILADENNGLEVPPTGLSAVFFQTTELDEELGVRITTSINYVESLDIVYDPGAGGYIKAALSALEEPRRFWLRPDLKGEINVKPEDVQNQANSPPPPTQPLPAAPPAPEDDEGIGLEAALQAINQVAQQVQAIGSQVTGLASQVETLTAAAAQQEEAQTIQGMGEPRISLGRTSLEQIEAATLALASGVAPPSGVRPLTGIRELYHLLSGDYEMTGMFRADRVYLANVTAATMAGLCANVLNKRVANMFQQYPRWWLPIVIEDDFASLQDVRWITLGGVGELPTVAAGAAYTELTWDDQSETESFVKKGGYLGLTLEAIDKDDTAKLRAAPRALAQGAWLTLSKSVSNIFTSNSGVGPTLDTDSTALFHANHSNLGSSALAWSSWVATRTAMRKQTELNSSERLGALTAPRYLLVPPDLEITGVQVLASEGEPGTADNDTNPEAEGNSHDARMRAARKRVVVVDLWTDTDNWAAVADPLLYASIGIGYRYGRVPEIFSVASPTAGLMFTNDTMPVKVRFFYACGVIDYRGMYKHNV